MKITEIAATLRSLIGESEPWDNDGVSIDMGNDIEKIAVCLDITSENIKKAASLGASAIVAHHPLIFKPLSSLSVDDAASKRIICCIEHGISAASFHTCLDIAEGGVNDTLCRLLGVENTSCFLPFGRIGDVTPRSFRDFLVHCEKTLGCTPFQTVDSGRIVKRVAIVSGGGKDEVRDAYFAGADTYLTGEASHAAMIDAAEYGINLVCCGHFETENPVVPILAELIRKQFPDIEVITLGA